MKIPGLSSVVKGMAAACALVFFVVAVDSYLEYGLEAKVDFLMHGAENTAATAAFIFVRDVIVFGGALSSLLFLFGRWGRFIVAPILCAMVAVWAFNYYGMEFWGQKLGRAWIPLVLGTTKEEALRFLTTFSDGEGGGVTSVLLLGGTVLAWVAIWWILCKARYPRLSVKRLAAFAVLIAPLCVFWAYRHATGGKVSTYMATASFAHDSKCGARMVFQELGALDKKRSTEVLPLEVAEGALPPVFVFVMGESATSEHWGLYGYVRDTTPAMDALAKDGELDVFKDVVSCAGFTRSSVPRFFTNMSYDYKGSIPPGGTESLPRILKRAGCDTVFIASQENGSAKFEVLTRIFQECDRQVILKEEFAGKRRWHDDDILPYFTATLARLRASEAGQAAPVQPKPLAVFIHAIGSHFPCGDEYCPPERYTWQLDAVDGANREFTPENRTRVNRYDNTIRFEDEVLGAIVAELKNLPNPSFFLYISDHGETPEFGKWRQATNSRYKVPMVVWLSPAYRQLHPDLAAKVAAAAGKPQQPDQMFWGLVELCGVKLQNPAGDEKSFLDADYQCRTPRRVLDGAAVYDPSRPRDLTYNAPAR